MSEPIEAYRLLPGMLLARKYRLSRKIGQGAMGVVWAARNEATGREVALKVIARPDPSLRKRLLREAQSCGALQHPNIVDVIDVARTESGEPCLIMELLVGDSVAALLEARRRLEAPLAVRIAHDVAGALAAAHAVQIVHRDLKPANVFLHRPPEAGDFVVKVLDFGVAKSLAAASGATSTLDVVGSPVYMSPEQLRADEDLDARADLWSLGVMLFEMLTGVRPFQGEGPQLLSQILSGEIPKVSRYLRRVDERLVRIVDRCLRRERQERFGTAEEVARELAAFASVAAALRESAGEAERGALGTTGERERLGTTGERERLGTTGERERLGTTGERGGLRTTGERVTPPPGSTAEQETAVAPARGQGSAPTAEELATTVPLARPGAPATEGGGGKAGVRQGGPVMQTALVAQTAHAMQGAQAGAQGAHAMQTAHAVQGAWSAAQRAHAMQGAQSMAQGTHAIQGALAVGHAVQGEAAPGGSIGAPAAGAGPMVTSRGTVVMRGKEAEAQQQAMAMVRAAQAQQVGARATSAHAAGTQAASAQAAAKVKPAGKAKQRGGRATVVAVTAVVGVLVGAIAATWLVGWGEPSPPTAADAGSGPVVGRAEATPRERATAAAMATPAATAAQPAAAERPAEGADAGRTGAAPVEQGHPNANAAPVEPSPGAAPQKGAVPPVPPVHGGTAVQARPSPTTGAAAATTGAQMAPPGGPSVRGKTSAAREVVYDDDPPQPPPPPARAASPAGATPTAEKQKTVPPRPF
ncbi:protein kinase [Sorangium sp. So ce134]